MTDIYDQAAEIEDMHRRIALENQAARTAGMAAVSAYECEECGEPIRQVRHSKDCGTAAMCWQRAWLRRKPNCKDWTNRVSGNGAGGETGRRLGQCLSCAEKRAAYRSKRYVSPGEVNKFPPAPEILNHVYWPKYS